MKMRFIVVLLALCLHSVAKCNWPFQLEESRMVRSCQGIPEIDFKVLDSAVADKRIVFLGEHGHGDGSTLEAKNKIIQHLHEKWNFDILLLELGLYETDKAFEDFLLGRDSLVGTFCWLTRFFPHMISKQDSALASYLQAQARAKDTLFLSGVDIPQVSIYGNAFFLEWDSLMQRLRQAPGFHEAYKSFLKATGKGKIRFFDNKNEYQSAHEPEKYLLVAENARIVSSFIQGNLQHLQDRAEIERAEFMLQAIAAWVGYWDHEANSPPRKHVKGHVTFDYFQIRDQYMAQNLLWLVQKKYPDKKIIVSTSTYHSSHGIGEILGKSRQVTIGTRPMLDIAWDELRMESLNIAFLRYEGTEGISTAWVKPIKPAKKNSIEWQLHASGNDYCFFPVTQDFDGKLMFPTWEKPLKANWSRMYDLVFFISKMNPVIITGLGKRIHLEQPYKLGREWYE